MLKIEKILFPIDFTENASKILPYVLSMSEKYDSMIYLLHVVEDLSKWGVGSFVPHLSLQSFQKDAMEGAEKAMNRVCDSQLRGCPNFQRMIVHGDPVMEILKAIESEGIDMVIMGTHGRKGLDHTFFGSVAENVVKRSDVPVLVVNPHKVKS
jgi:nucleotide-binding universal stress UspA family protein